ncbi:MAG: alpha/beta family hydrolase, partial [Vicinamibacterales bacterium]
THISAQGVEGVRGVVLLGYPLHPPGQPQKRRDSHLPNVNLPMLFVQGSSDTFGNAAEMTELMPSMQKATLHVIAGGDHSFKVKGGAKGQQVAFDEVMDVVAAWVQSSIADR